MATGRFNARGRFVAAIVDGCVQGALLFAILLFAEAIALGPAIRSTLGAPMPTIIAIYVLAGGGVGGALGFLAWLAARAVSLRAAKVSFTLLACTCGALFALRSVPSEELAVLSPRLVAVLAGGLIALVLGMGWSRRGAGRLESSRVGSMRFAGVVAAAAACTISAAWVPLRHHRPTARHNAPADAPNVVFVLVDALRADRLSCFGYDRPTSPFIDRLASRGTAFTNAYSHGNRTIIAMPSLFTSMYPSYARAIDGGNWSTPLPDSQFTLAEMFQDAGYTTMAMMSNPYLKRPFGLTQGFDRVEEFTSGRFYLSLYRVLVATGVVRKPRHADGVQATAKEVTDTAVDWLGRVPPQAPFFCYIHYMDTHHPYLPPRVYEDMFNSHDWPSSIEPFALFAKTIALIREKRPYPLDQDELTRLSDLYDGSIRYVDAEIARAVDVAQRVNGRPTIVVVTSDHGDEFQEHGSLYHNNVVIEELIRVPIVIWRSDRLEPGRRVEALVRHVDVLPTLAEWIGVEAPSSAVGRSLSSLMVGDAEDKPRASVAEGDYCSALVEPGWKLMHVDTAGSDVLFDLGVDRAAKRDVARFHPERFGRMQASLDAYFHAAPAAGPAASAEVDAATLRQLQALGYIN